MNKLLASAAVTVLAFGLALLILPVSHVPLLDANRQVLVESEAGGFCAGVVYMESRGYGSEQGMADCMAETNRSNDVDYAMVQPAFCAGVISKGLPLSHAECVDILTAEELWPTANGSLTASWNRRFPYPGDFLTANQPSTGGESRTGDRIDNDREGNTR